MAWMPRGRSALLAVVIAMLAAQAAACRAKPQPVLFPVGPPIPEATIQEYVSLGDSLFPGMHLYAWRRAEEAYARALTIAPRREIRDKLSLTRLLRMTREIDEDIACPTLTADIDFICGETGDARSQAYCDLARSYASGSAAAARKAITADPSVFGVEESTLNAYVYMLYSRAFATDAVTENLRKRLAENNRDTPLFAYLNFPTGAALSRFLQRYPEFAEAWEYAAELNFQARAIKEARAAFARTLELIPDYTRAINGLANIYFFTLEDYANALLTYEKALRLDPQNSAALFGKGASLHHLGRYDESDVAMDRMLETDLSRRGRVGADSIRYFRGEGYYYKAHNAYLQKDPSRARALIDEAKRFLPNAEEINYLSGLLYYNADQLDPAKTDMEIAARSGSNCYAYHYLGLIALKQKGPGAASQFLTSGTCLERSLRTLQDNVRAAAALDIDATEKEALRLRMQMKLVAYRDSSAELLQTMIALIRDADLSEDWKKIYLDTMTDFLAKTRAIKP